MREREKVLVSIETEVLEISHSSGIYSRILMASPSACIWSGYRYRSGTGDLMCFLFGSFCNLTIRVSYVCPA